MRGGGYMRGGVSATRVDLWRPTPIDACAVSDVPPYYERDKTQPQLLRLPHSQVIATPVAKHLDKPRAVTETECIDEQ